MKLPPRNDASGAPFGRPPFALRADARAKPRSLEIRAEGDEATVYVYDVIDAYWGVGAQAFVKELNALTAQTIHLRINSPGGDVFEARAMATAIKGHQARVIAHIDGYCASAATFLATAAAEAEITEGGFYMIHNAWSLAYGNASDLRQLADLLDKIDDTIRADYRKKTAKTDEEIAAWMAAETWFTAEEAKAAGFVDRVFTGETVENLWQIEQYARAPQALREPPAPPPAPEDLTRARALLRARGALQPT